MVMIRSGDVEDLGQKIRALADKGSPGGVS